MIYPENAAEKLGFVEIKELIKANCLSMMGKEMVDKIQPMHQYGQIDKFLRQTHEFKDILENDSPLPIDHLYPIRTFADRIRVEGSFLSEEEFFQISLSLKTVFSVINYFNERKGVYEALEMLFEHLTIERTIVKNIDNVIDQNGSMKPSASPKLQEIFREIAYAERESRKRMDALLKKAQDAGWTADGGLTVRDGRLCIPILAENKRKIKGYIHDESATGQTVYLEPEEVFQLNNQLRDLEFDKRREKVRILIALTTELRPFVPSLISYHGLLSKLDFVRAKALFAIDIEATMPELQKEASLNFINARHPLLFLNFRREGQTVVPLNVAIDETQRIIVVSGPNAGGKSVCMKTIGLLQMMVQAGLLIPVDPNSKVGVFRNFFADIGDDQSIESDLSTYSAHLSKMRYFMEHSNSRSLILIDEFGAGTDPQFGGPIAEAVLQNLNKKKVRGVITTHYSNLKLFANATEGLENASMLFDNAAMQPRYILEIGKPGSSYAFEIAYKIGLPQDVLQGAKQKIGTQQKKVDHLLVDLEREKKEVHEAKVKLKRNEDKLNRLLKENEERSAFLEENKKQMMKQAKLEAQEVLKNANRLVENTIAQIKESNADKEKTKELRKVLDSELVKNKSIAPNKKTVQKDEELAIGDWVKILDTGTMAQIIEIAKGNLILAIGDLRSVVKKNRVEKTSNKEVSKSLKRAHGTQLTESLANFNPEIDVRGMRTEAALYEIEKYLDKAIMMSFPSLKIVHGKGNGILRKMIRDYLRKYKEVDRLEDEHLDRGGDGVTYVYFV
ncbi:endonuclease MutS2 [Albibacterium profundi]|uniref:Endonuclease MutS2 n=1 Tax=Albibacterium profundi TaxID=3134906 RepID=A0ABV5CG51_9SPHI